MLYQYDLPVEPWLSGILRHKHYESWCQAGNSHNQPLAEDDSWHPVVELDEDEQFAAVCRLLAPLNDRQAQALFATKVEELSVSETASLMQRSTAWVKVNVHRAVSPFAAESILRLSVLLLGLCALLLLLPLGVRADWGLLAATVYSLHCPVDALAYLLTAYLLATAIIVGFGWLLSRRLWCW